jgi:pantetheine-phosphate adenylyltransferase
VQIAVYPGSFDPLTLGHLNIVERASALFPHLIVAVVQNPNKQTLFNLSERREMVAQSVRHLPNVQVDSFQGLLVNYLRRQSSTCVVKGIRHGGDFENELQMARLNAGLAGIESVFLPAEARVGHYSSTMVREIAALGGDVASMVPPGIVERLHAKFAKMKEGE